MTGMPLESSVSNTLKGEEIFKGQRVHAPKDNMRDVSQFDLVAIVKQCELKCVRLTGYLQAVGVWLHYVSHLYRSQGLQRNMQTLNMLQKELLM